MVIILRLTKPGLTKIWHILSKLDIDQFVSGNSHIIIFQLKIDDLTQPNMQLFRASYKI